MNDVAMMEMPRYICTKKVWALQIEKIEVKENGSAMITPVEKGYAPFPVDSAYMMKHKPYVGGYYVVYKDGYKSFSPAKAFQDGYTLIEKG